MAGKVVVIGYTNSGKTTYLAGMYATMSSVIKNFSLIAKDPASVLRLNTLWEQIKAGIAPPATNALDSYTFQLTHNFETMFDFEWLDYPGAFLTNVNTKEYEQLINSICKADCLIFIVNGDFLVVENPQSPDDYKTRLENKLQLNVELNTQFACLNALATRNISLPPTAIVVTKCDLIDVQYADIFRAVLRKSFSAIFEAPKRIVMQAAVSLGGSIKENFIPTPICLEQPIAFAALMIFTKAVMTARNIIKESADFILKTDGFFSRIANHERRMIAGLSIAVLRERMPVLSEHYSSLINIFPAEKTIYIGGKEYNLRKLFTKTIEKFSEQKTFKIEVENWVEFSQEEMNLRDYHAKTIKKLSEKLSL